MAVIAPDLSRADVQILLVEADKNKDGKIQFTEFVDWLIKPTKESLGRAVIGYSQAFKPLFDVYDKDDTGFISKENFEECHCLIQASLSLTDADDDRAHRRDALLLKQDHMEAFKLIDTGRTGEITFLEFVNWMKEHVPAGMDPKELKLCNDALAATLKDAWAHIQMAEEGYIKESDAHILQGVIAKLAESTAKLQGMMRVKTGKLDKPQWTEPPIGLSIDRLKTTHMAVVPVNTKRVAKVAWEILCLPMPGDYEDVESRIWLAEVIRKVHWKKGDMTTEEPDYYVYERKTFQWATLSDKSSQIFEDTFSQLTPGVGLFCLLKTAANFGSKICWADIECAIQGGTDMNMITQAQADTFLLHMRNIAIQNLKNEGFLDDENSEESQISCAEEWLTSMLSVRPRMVMATLSDLGIVEVDPAWEDFDSMGED